MKYTENILKKNDSKYFLHENWKSQFRQWMHRQFCLVQA